MLERAGLDVGANVISEIDMTFTNTKVLVLSDEFRFGLEAKYLKGDCLHAVLRITEVDKKCVTQPISAMQADINYHVKFSNEVDASDKEKILSKVFGALATDGRTDTSDSIISRAFS